MSLCFVWGWRATSLNRVFRKVGLVVYPVYRSGWVNTQSRRTFGRKIRLIFVPRPLASVRLDEYSLGDICHTKSGLLKRKHNINARWKFSLFRWLSAAKMFWRQLLSAEYEIFVHLPATSKVIASPTSPIGSWVAVSSFVPISGYRRWFHDFGIFQEFSWSRIHCSCVVVQCIGLRSLVVVNVNSPRLIRGVLEWDITEAFQCRGWPFKLPKTSSTTSLKQTSDAPWSHGRICTC